MIAALCFLLLQRLHLLQNGKLGQPCSQRRPAADTGCGEVLQQCGGSVLQRQQGTPIHVNDQSAALPHHAGVIRPQWDVNPLYTSEYHHPVGRVDGEQGDTAESN